MRTHTACTYGFVALTHAIFMGVPIGAQSTPDRNAGTCTISGLVTGRLGAIECLDPDCSKTQRHKLREFVLLTATSEKKIAQTTVTMKPVKGGREWRYSFSKVPAGATYLVRPMPPWRLEPEHKPITCESSTSHTLNVHVKFVSTVE